MSSSFTEKPCRICGVTDRHQLFLASEMMFGTGKQFRYFQCCSCETLQIETIEADMSAWYPSNYYSMRRPGRWQQCFLEFARFRRDEYLRTGNGLIGMLANAFQPDQSPIVLRRIAAMDRNASVLDVGCGENPAYLHRLRRLGFSSLLGIDPYLDADRFIAPGFTLQRHPLEEVTGQFHLVMLHHSFEHLADPKGAFASLRRLVRSDGLVVIRTPTVSSYAWRHYGVDWAQLEAPRHLHLLSVKALSRLAELSGFTIQEIIFDSTAFQFWRSEQIRRGQPLHQEPRLSRAMRRYRAEANRLNSTHEGDSVAVFLKPC